MKIIGAGFGRTGTMSLKAALEELGFPCYHMEEVAKNIKRGHAEIWVDAYTRSNEIDWEKLLDGYDAIVDAPGCLFYKELMTAYPEAPVILTVRDGESWWNSFEKLYHVNHNLRFLTFLPFFRKFYSVFIAIIDDVFNNDMSKQNCIASFEKHNANVEAHVPPERLLIYTVSEGWEPLCTFLNVDIPDTPFPHTNSGVDGVKKKFRGFLRDQLLHRIMGSKHIKD
jgi:hypothetical protein